MIGLPAGPARSGGATAVAAGPARPAPRRQKWLVAAGAALGLAAVVLVALFLILGNRRGTLVIESDDPNAQVSVRQGGELVEVVDAQSGWKISLKAGRYELSVKGGPDQIVLDQNSVMVRHGDVTRVKLTLKRAKPETIASSARATAAARA